MASLQAGMVQICGQRDHVASMRSRPACFCPRPRNPRFRPRNRIAGATASAGAVGVAQSSSPSDGDGTVVVAPAISTAAEAKPRALSEEARLDKIEAWLENRIFNCRFLTLLAVVGSLAGSALCFVKGSILVFDSLKVFVLNCLKGINSGKVILLLVEALDVYLIGTVMLIFGVGLYELFVDTLDLPRDVMASSLLRSQSSSLFGLFLLKARPKWLQIHSLDEMKTKLGHVIVMILLVGMFEKSKKVAIYTAKDLFLFSSSVSLAAVSLFLLSKLQGGGLLEDFKIS